LFNPARWGKFVQKEYPAWNGDTAWRAMVRIEASRALLVTRRVAAVAIVRAASEDLSAHADETAQAKGDQQ
jgi:hypothetical protein